MPRLAWFSPMPPARTGIATDSAVLVAALSRQFDIDVFVDRDASAHEPKAPAALACPAAVRPAHDFPWQHRRIPYDLTVYQLGNSSLHEYIWPYLFRYPGLAVLHDARLHHSRAAALLGHHRADHYRAEFAANHPGADASLAELAVAGFDSNLYYMWPMTRLIALSSRVTAVHTGFAAAALSEEAPTATIERLRLGHGEYISRERLTRTRREVRERHAIPDDALVFGVFGGLSPDKRVRQILDAFEALRPYHPRARLLLVGGLATHYDAAADVRTRGLEEVATLTGYLHGEAFDDYVCACDVSLNLRWPTAREMSGPWLRALAAGRPTVILDLAHLADVPSLDPRTWTLMHTAAAAGDAPPEPVTIAIDVLDEDHSLRLAMRRLAADGDLRERLGRAAAAYWQREHSHERMVADYRRAIARALDTPDPHPVLPPHLRATGAERLHELAARFGLAENVWGTI